jgi:acetyltransferase-like isoleucine patch superfamily enzyme
MRHDFPFIKFEGVLHRLYAPVFRLRFRRYGKGAFVSPYATVLGTEHIAIGTHSSVGRRSLLVIVPQPDSGATSQITIGDKTYVGRGCTLAACGSIELGNEITIGDNVYVSAGQHGFGEPGTRVLEQPMQTGTVRVEDGAWIGYGAFISSTSSLTIGRGAIVAANAVVTRDVPALTMVGGVPARTIRRFDPHQKQWVRVAASGVSNGS